MSSKKQITRIFSWTLCFLLVFSSFVYAQPNDIKNHWAKKQIGDWYDKGLIKGYPDGTFKPNNPISRAQVIALINRAFGFTEKADIGFTDVAEKSWYYDDIRKAKAAGYIADNGGAFKPDKNLTRQEAAVMLYYVMKLTADNDEKTCKQFKDVNSIEMTVRPYVGAVVKAGYMLGNPDHTFNPQKTITRAETVTVLNRAAGTLFNKACDYGLNEEVQTIEGNVTINTAGIKLHNKIIKGDLYLTAGIGDGNVLLDNVKVEGKTLVCGGGSHSIIIRNSDMGLVFIDKETGDVIRVVAEGSTTISNVILKSGARLEEGTITSIGFGDVTIDVTLGEGETIEFDGDFGNIYIGAHDVNVEVLNGTIASLSVAEGIEGVDLTINKDAEVTTLTLDSAALVQGEGTIGTAEINAGGAVIEQKPDNIEIADNVTAVVDGREVNKETAASIPVSGISINGTSLTLAINQSAQLTAAVAPENATNKKINWSSSNTTVATVDGSGKVTGVSAGTATITVSTEDGNKTASCSVTVTAPQPPAGGGTGPVLSSNANLSSLVLNYGTITFSADTTSYTVNVGSQVDSIRVTPSVADTTATVKVNNTSVTSGQASGDITLNPGNNTIAVLVTAQNGTAKTYSIAIYRAFSIIGITVSNGTISLTFNGSPSGLTSSDFNIEAALDGNSYTLGGLSFNSENNSLSFDAVVKTDADQQLQVTVSSSGNTEKINGSVDGTLTIGKFAYSTYTLTIDGAAEAKTGDVLLFNVSAKGDGTGERGYTAIYDYEITGGAGTLEYKAGETWIPLPLKGQFGPPAGFELTPGWDAATQLHFTPSEAGSYNVSIILRTIAGTVLASANHNLTVTAPAYVALGDSIAYGLSATNPENRYVNLLYNHLKGTAGNEGLVLNNLAIPGATSTDLLNSLRQNEDLRTAVTNASVISISIGGNNLLGPVIAAVSAATGISADRLAVDLPVFIQNHPDEWAQIMNTLALSQDFHVTLESGATQFVSDWGQIIQVINALNPNARIYMMTLYNPMTSEQSNQSSFPLYNYFGFLLGQMNTAILSTGLEYDVADVNKAFMLYSGADPLVNFNLATGAVDPHPTDAGHNVIYQAHLNTVEPNYKVIAGIISAANGSIKLEVMNPSNPVNPGEGLTINDFVIGISLYGGLDNLRFDPDTCTITFTPIVQTGIPQYLTIVINASPLSTTLKGSVIVNIIIPPAAPVASIDSNDSHTIVVNGTEGALIKLYYKETSGYVPEGNENGQLTAIIVNGTASFSNRGYGTYAVTQTVGRVESGYSNEVTLEDKTAPVFLEGFPRIDNITAETFDLTFALNEESNVYYAVMPAGAAAPAVNDIVNSALNGQLVNGAIISGVTRPVEPGIPNTFYAQGLPIVNEQAVDLDVYVVAADTAAAPNIQASAVKLEIRRTRLEIMAPNITAASGIQFNLPVTIKGTVGNDYADSKVRFYAIVDGLKSNDIQVGSVGDMGTPEIVQQTDEVDPLVLAWGLAEGFTLKDHQLEYESANGLTTVFPVTITKGGIFTVHYFLIYISTEGNVKTIADGSNTITIPENIPPT